MLVPRKSRQDISKYCKGPTAYSRSSFLAEGLSRLWQHSALRFFSSLTEAPLRFAFSSIQQLFKPLHSRATRCASSRSGRPNAERCEKAFFSFLNALLQSHPTLPFKNSNGKKEARSYGLPGKDCYKMPKAFGIKQSGSITSKDTIYSVSFWLLHGSPLPECFLFSLFLLKSFYGLSNPLRK
jgi:hypothetical protein